MTPGIKLAEREKVAHTVHEYVHDNTAESFGLEAAEKLQVEEQRVFKTLVVCLDNQQLVVSVLPVSSKLSLKKVAKAFGVKKAVMAEPSAVERSTGYVLGGVSPLGQKKQLKSLIDISAQHFDSIFVSAGKRGLEIELAPDDLLRLIKGRYLDLIL